MQNMSGRVALVTGAASGIGQESARLFAKAGAAVLVCDVADGAGTVGLIEAQGGTAAFRKVDITREDEVEAAVAEAVTRFGSLDFAHNNAGVTGPAAPFHQWSAQQLRDTLEVNTVGTFLCMKYELAAMLEQETGGSIVNTASTAGVRGLPSMSGYCASKHGVVGLTKAAALEYARKRIRVNSICPGTTYTPMMEAWIGDDPEVEAFMNENPFGRMATSLEQAEVAFWLCSDHASYVSGLAIPVDGALLCGASGGKRTE